MKKRINLVVFLMAICTAFLLGLQLYWNYQAYQNSVKTFRSQTNDALDKAVEQLTNIRKDEILADYKKWLADTNLIVVACKYNAEAKQTVFTIRDKYPINKRRPFYLSINDFKGKLNQITPEAKIFFIDHFVKGTIRGNLETKSAYYFTQSLGDKLVEAYDKDRLNLTRLDSIFKRELLKRDINSSYHFIAKKFIFKNFNETNEPLKENSFGTRAYNYGFKEPFKAISAWFPDPNLIFLKKMKWVLLSSLILICITIFCFTYTAKIIFKQKKLAELKNDFVNNMTHELKTPVATINIAAEAIQDFNLSKASADEYLEIIRYQAGNLTNLIDQILKSVVSQQEDVALNLSKVNINQLIGSIIQEYKPQSQLANVNIIYKSGDEDLTGMADGNLLKNAIANLVDNAIKYSGPDSLVNISGHVENSSIIINVCDNGPGIPAQYQDKVFDRFFRVPSGDLHNVKGYGLGLSYAKSIIEKHKGSLSLTSKEGRGTEFIISIPLIYNETSQSSVT
ncbi:sensor histidine kinase KdpD [Mucilaginibacter sp.]|uniref:sensor histidine kinase n=1 Tax=Mucilaginibacter sp. TaxID=1882438 RepID=UPI0026018E65|nr:HAMP domain-containing sensor histidine kinase [Mucilaginibacter sp.]